MDMWLDDEGLHTQPVNLAATELARQHGYSSQRYHGPVLIAGFNPEDGTTAGLNPDQIRAVLTRLLDAADLL
jgi:hypothetical protein